MTAKRSTNWFWSDWSGDQAVRRLTPAERGLWIDLLAMAAVAAPTGYVCDERGNPVSYEEMGRFANCSPTEAESLVAGILEKGVAGRDRTGRLFNRRMVRDTVLSEKRRRAGSAGAAATRQKWQTISGLPGDLPGHVPRQPGRAPLPKQNLDSSAVAAREDSATEPRGNGIAATDDLATVIAKKGWAKGK